MFNVAIDSKLRGCDVVTLKVEDIAPNGYAIDRATVRQRKTGRPVKFELTDQTRQAVDEYLRAAGKSLANFCSRAAAGLGRCMTTRQYARLVSGWIARRHPFAAAHQANADLPTYRQPAGCPALVRKGDILPANNRLKHASP